MMNGITTKVKLYVDNLVLLDLRKLRTVDTLDRQEVSKAKCMNKNHTMLYMRTCVSVYVCVVCFVTIIWENISSHHTRHFKSYLFV